MAETNYVQAQVDALIEDNASLGRTATEKYAQYKSKDPFPNVGEALLNSVDLLMYILTVGIVEPFDVNNLKGETYRCAFSGEAHQFDSETGGMKQININDDQELKLEPNSITYLKIEENFRVPEYMVLRFNLSVSNAYKGILLGTGPIVDSGFEGNLFIPLHNLTGNEYTIKKGASLIRVEFTKLSTHAEWKIKKSSLKPIPASLKPITKETPKNAMFSTFFKEALLDPNKKMFRTSGGVVSVRSSIPDAIAESAKKAAEANASANSAASDARNSATNAENLSKDIRKWSIIGGIGALIAVAALMISVYTLIHDTNTRYDTMSQQIKDYQSTNIQYQEIINNLQRRLTSLEIDYMKERLELLTDEYASIIDKNSDSANNLNKQIIKLKEEIADLQND